MAKKKRGGAVSVSSRSASPSSNQSPTHTHTGNGWSAPLNNSSPSHSNSEHVNQSESQSVNPSPLAPSILPSLIRQLTCWICDNPFDETSRKPMILHAGHTMCEVCIQQFRPINVSENDVISCPLCQTTVRRSEAAVNHVVLDIVKSCGAWSSSSPSSASEVNSKSCDLCHEEEVESDAAVYCFDCLEWMCDDHARIHSRKKDKASHHTSTCEQIHADPQLGKSVRSKRFPLILCQKHEIKLEFYCVPCGKFLCLTCATDHARHTKEDLFVRFNQQTVQSTELIAAFKQLEPRRRKCLELITENIASIEQQERKELTDIDQTVISMTQLLEKAKQQEKILASQIEEQVHSERSSWQSKQQSVSTARERILASISDLEQCISKRDYLSINESANKLQESIKQSRAALAPFVEFETKQFLLASDTALQSVSVELAQQLDTHMGHWFTPAPSDYSIEKVIRLATPAPVSQAKQAGKQPKKKSKMAKAAAKFAVQQHQAQQEEQKVQVAASESLKAASEASSSAVVKRLNKMSWPALYSKVKSHLASQHSSSEPNARKLLALAEDLRAFSLNRNLDVIEIDECEFAELVIFIRANLAPKHLALFAALSETLINLLSVCTMDCMEPWFEDDFAEIMQICMRILRPVNQLSIQYEALTYRYAIAHRLVWALPGNRLAQTALKSNQKIGMYRINFNDRVDELEGLVGPLKLNSSVKAITATQKPLTEKAVRGLVQILASQRSMRSLSLNLYKVSPAAVNAFFDSLKHLPVLSSLQLMFGFTQKPIVGSYLKHLFSLTTLQISAAQLGDDGIQIICEKLVQMPNLRKLFLGKCGIGNKGMTTLGQNLHKIPLLRHLSLTINKHEDEAHDKGMQALIANLKHVPQLAVLELQHTAMKDASFRALGDNLKFLPHMQELRLSCSDPDGPKAGFQVLCQNFHFTPRMKVLELSSCNLDSNAIDALSAVILNGSLINLDYICLNNCDKLRPETVRKLAESFIQLTCLRELLMSYCQLDAARCVILCEQFKHLPNLRHIDFGNNNIGGAGCRALAENLRYCPLLETLTLETCTIDDSGLRSLSASFPHIMLLQALDLSNNKLTNLSSLAENLTPLSQLRELQLSENKFTECLSLFTRLQCVPLLRVLGLREVNLREKDIFGLVDSLKQIPLLRVLDVSCNSHVTDSAAVSIANAFKHVPLLTSLHINDTHTGSEAVKAIRANMQYLHYLRLIDCSNIHCRDPADIRSLKGFMAQYHPLVNFIFNDGEDDEDEEDYSDSE